MGNTHSSEFYVEPLAPQAHPATAAEISYCPSGFGKQVFHPTTVDPGPADFSRASSADTAAVLGRDRSGLSSGGCTPKVSPGVGPSVPTATAVPISWEKASRMVRANSVAVCWSLSAWLDELEMPSREIMERCARESELRAPKEQLMRVEEAVSETVTSDASDDVAGNRVLWGIERSKEEEELDCHHHVHEAMGNTLEEKCMLLEGCPHW